MQKFLKIPLLAALPLVVTALFSMQTFASGGFSVTPRFPENQREGVSGYYDLMMQPGEQQTLTVDVTNSSSTEEMAVIVEIVTATTNINGIVNYSTPGESDESLQHNISELVTTPEQRVVVSPNETAEVTFSIAAPAEDFDGYLLGGLSFTKELTESDEATGMFTNQYGYVLALRINGPNPEVDPELEMGEVQAELINGRININSRVRNVSPRLISGAKGTLQIFRSGETESLYERNDSMLEFAPNSVFSYVVVEDSGQRLESGDYISKIHLEYEGKQWDFETPFVVDAQTADELNGQAVETATEPEPAPTGGNDFPLWAWILIGVVTLVLIVVIIIALIMHKNNKDYMEYMQMMLEKQRQSNGDRGQTTPKP